MDLATKTPQGLKLWFSSYQCSCKGVEAVNNSAVSGFQVLSLGSHYSFNATQDWKEISWYVLPCSIQWPHLDPGNCSLHFWNALCDHSVAVSIQGNSEVRIVFSCVLIADGKMWTDGEAEISVHVCCCPFLSHACTLCSHLTLRDFFQNKSCCVYLSGVKVFRYSSKYIFWII